MNRNLILTVVLAAVAVARCDREEASAMLATFAQQCARECGSPMAWNVASVVGDATLRVALADSATAAAGIFAIAIKGGE